MKLVVGLGNPGGKYQRTRHNAGAWWVERLAADAKAVFRVETKFHGRVAALENDSRLLLPDTYMNESGLAVAALAAFYKIAPREILVAHDELDLPPGGVKLKLGGGVAGHNGLKDIAVRLGSHDFWRLRIGIGHPRDSAGEQEVVDYVLHPPRAEERAAIDDAIARSLAVWPSIAADDMENAMLKLHTREKSPE
ncbi:MAG TPA: aminoacyl-tRNA hydrolase [Burkholderiales bacterium]|nr:aminoacyl-tRNA hydrolase [Burkholderiales bacterium]